MSKFVKVPNGDYKLAVQPGGTITLDAGEGGNVVVAGNLVIEGATTVISAENLEITDNIIVLNNGEQGAGVSLDVSGIEIDRGTEPNTYFVFDENMSWTDPSTGATRSGGFVFTDALDLSGSLVGIRTNSISTAGGNLFIEPANALVALPDNYEQRINSLSVSDVDKDRVVPNVGWVQQEMDALFTSITTQGISQISQGVSSRTRVAVLDEETTNTTSFIEFAIDNTIISQMFSDVWTFNDLRFSNSTITNTQDGVNLVLRSDGIGSVQVDDVLSLSQLSSAQVNDEIAPASGVKLYSAPEQAGKTGIYYINSANTQDEIAGKKRALLFSMLF